MKTIKRILNIFVLAFTISSIQVKSQVRSTTINSLGAQDQNDLADLIRDYLDESVIATHAATMVNPPVLPMSYMVHMNENFLPFHREYIAGLEDYLILQGYPQFVPLPKWEPELGIPTPFQQISPDCNSAFPTATCNPLVNVGPNSLRAMSHPNHNINSNLCLYNEDDIMGVGVQPNVQQISVLESPWHNYVHNNLGGVMATGKSPGAVIFLPWHAYVDDVWKEWECNCANAPDVDLWMRDTPMRLAANPNAMHPMSMDVGNEPNNESDPWYMWVSEDIWIRNNQDGFTTDVHENPEYNGVDPVYVYVRVRNRGCEASLGTAELQLSWAKAATNLSWPNPWDGSLNNLPPNPQVEWGDEVDTKLISSIPAGGSTILEFEWFPPDPDDYDIINPEPWHFCLLARIVASNDPMSFTETSDLFANVKNNNNIVWKNVTVVHGSNLVGDDNRPGGVIAFGNVFQNDELFDLEFLSLDFEGEHIVNEAEIRLTLDEEAWNIWVDGGQVADNIEIFREDERQLIVTGNNALLGNLGFEPDQRATMMVSFNFLTGVASSQEEFFYHVVQRTSSGSHVIGGEKYHIIKPDPSRQLFAAYGGRDESISIGDSVLLSASSVREPAIYNWYDSDGRRLYSGPDFNAKPLHTQNYKLEIIAESDGYKDYDEIMVEVKSYGIINLSPNPATSDVSVEYAVNTASSVSLQITKPFSGISNNYILDPQKDEIVVDVSAYQAGVYNVILIVDGRAVDSKSLIVQ